MVARRALIVGLFALAVVAVVCEEQYHPDDESFFANTNEDWKVSERVRRSPFLGTLGKEIIRGVGQEVGNEVANQGINAINNEMQKPRPTTTPTPIYPEWYSGYWKDAGDLTNNLISRYRY